MSPDLSPRAVAARLDRLRELYVPYTEDEARRRLEGAPSRAETFAQQVARRLAELRALCELTRYLHRGRGVRHDSPGSSRVA